MGRRINDEIITQGDERTFTFPLKSVDPYAVYPVTGKTFSMKISLFNSDTTVLTLTGSINDATKGWVDFTFTGAQTSALATDRHEGHIIVNDGSKDITVRRPFYFRVRAEKS
jgi:hypothetical protein